MNEEKKIKIYKDQEIKEIATDKEDDKKNKIKYDIKVVEEKDVKFSKLEKNTESSDTIKVKYKKSGDKEYGTNEAEVKVLYDGGHFFHSFKLPNGTKLGTDVTTTEISNKGFKTNKHSVTLVSYISLIAVLLLVVGIIWWWISSSKSEDKEEESL